MRKLLIMGIVISGLVLAGVTTASANQAKRLKCESKCSKCESKCLRYQNEAKTCKITKLKNKVKLLWHNKQDLGLKDDQLSKIKDIKHAAIKKMIQLKADKEIVAVDLKSALYEDVINVEAVNKLIEAKYAAKEETAKTSVKAVSDIQEILTKDQRGQWKSLIKRAKDKKSCPMSKGMGAKFCPLTGKPLDKK